MPQYAVFGNPIAHSLSPQLHQAFAAQFNFTIDYQKILVPLDAFEKTIDDFRAQGGLGCNITLPFKTHAFHYANELTERARMAGAVNTVIFRDNICIGDNTDGVGLIRDLKNHAIDLRDKNMVIIGAGGATRGILAPIIQEKPRKISILNRTKANTQKLMDDFAKLFTVDFFNEKESIDVLINAVHVDFQTEFLFRLNLENTICYDLNYGARHQTFRDYAESCGAKKIIDGFGMLVEQGAEAFFQWFGKMPNTTIFLNEDTKITWLHDSAYTTKITQKLARQCERQCSFPGARTDVRASA